HIPMTGLCTVSLHGRSDSAPLFAALTHHDHVGVYTDGVNDPAVLARGVLERDVSGVAMHIFEDLGMDSERIRCLEPEEAAREQFSSLSFVIFERRTRSAHALHFGMLDALFEREKGLITKGPVRAVGLAALELRQDSVLWDLGAGCGSVGIEAASVIRTGRVVAVERRPSRMDLVRENRARTGAWLVDAVCARLPEGLEDLPDPDRVFMGGGVRTPGVVEAVLDRLAPGGILVANVVLLESLHLLMDKGRERGCEVRVTQVCASESAPLGGGIRLQGLNPVFVIAVRKPKQEGCNA
ncbi:MAG TPA: precorrin-6Y C5,15-methyltransferase (decarboxylating) subunit CbiT, partial [Desulfomicrobiaceae bacterium]|nr:precorrin-6Y C5,15-methyltransferase (decarboxylating) subunit CbiT [Desulfomicrobiaceae bacterium]